MIKIKKIFALILSLMLALQSAFYIQPAKEVQATTTMKSLFDTTTVVHGNETAGKKAVYGIDVSHYQKTIDWAKVRAAGVEFAFIKIGGSSLSNGSFYSDAYYAKNLDQAKAAGIKVGIYYFSQATNAEEAQQEVNYLFRLLGSRTLDLPVAYDAEFGSSTTSKLYKACKAAGGESSAKWKAQWTNIAMAFCSAVEARGYKAAFYGSVSKVVKKINYAPIDAKYQMWIARYATTNQLLKGYTYNGSYEFFQYSDHGRVNGISGNVDLDIYYAPASSSYLGCDYYNKLSTTTSTVTPASGSLKTKAKTVIRKTAATSGKKVLTVAKGKTLKITGTTTGKDKKTWYKVTYTKSKKTYTGFVSSSYVAKVKTATTSKATVIRKTAKTTGKKVVKVAAGASVSISYTAKDKKKNVWYQVSYKKGTKTYTGFILKSCLQL